MLEQLLRRPALAILCLFLALIGTDAHAAVGRTAGQSSVGATGSAQYSIPIWTPPGINGLQPSVALVYSSSSGDGLAGMGWTVSGLSAITRCSKTIAQDGVTQRVGMALTDKFCLDGSRLRLVSGAYGVAGSTYRTEIESFRLITANGTAGNGPAWFEVKAKDGLIYEYGNSTNSRIESLAIGGGQTTTARVWALNKIRDRAGNTIEFVYTEDTTYGSFRPAEISWNGVSPNYKILFTYEVATRPDVLYGYRFGDNATSIDGQITEIKRLDKIEVQYVPTSTLLHRYDLTYEASGGAGGRSRLQSIQECAGSAGTDCFPATTFSWINGTVAWNAETSTGQTVPAGIQPFLMDISGDGRDDIVYSSHVTSGSGYWTYMLANSSGGFNAAVPSSWLNTNYTQAFPIEWDGDGLMDILVPYSGGTWHVLRANGAGFDAPLNTTVSSTGTFWAADVDGDGRDDLLRVANGTVHGCTSTSTIQRRLRSGSAFSAEATHATLGPCQIAYTSTPFGTVDFKMKSSHRRPDFDGDGSEDAMLSIEEKDPELPGTFYYTARAILSTGWDSGAWEFSLTGVNTWRYGDFNGDGLTDFGYLSSAFFIRPSRGESAGTAVGISLSGYSVATVLLMDWDSDGLDDVVVGKVSPATWWVSRSTGVSLATLLNTTLTLAANANVTPRVADHTGDGLHDIVLVDVPGSNTLKYRAHSGVQPDLLDQATDGFGVLANFDYAPLTDSTVYTKLSGSVFPTREYQGAMHVARKLTFSNGTGGTSEITYAYQGARIHSQGRGFLGFARRTQVDSRNGIYTEANFQQDAAEYAWIGTPSSVIVKQSAGGNKIRESTNTWQKYIYGTGFDERRFPYVSQSVAKDYEVTAPYNGTHIRTVTTDASVDTWGTATDVTATTTEVATGLSTGATHTQRVYHPFVTNDSTNWCLSKPTQTQFINSHSLTGGTLITRTVDRTWDYLNCRPTQEIVEPTSTQWKVTTDLGYDSFGNVNSQTVTPVGQAARTTGINWGSSGQFPLTITNPLSQTVTGTWIVEQGLLDTVTDPNGLVVNLDYDTFNRKTRELRPDGTATRWILANCDAGNSYCGFGDTLLKYRVQTDLRNISDGLIQDSYVSLDAFGRAKYLENRLVDGGNAYSRNDYDALGRVSSQLIPRIGGSADPTKVVNFYYDLLNRPTQAARQVSEQDTSTQSTQWTYNGLSVTETDALTHTTTRYFTAVGQVAQVIDAAGSDTDYEYDGFGNLLKTRDVYGNEVSMGYNVRGFKTSQIDPDMGNWTYDYFPLGELKSQTDAKSQTTTFSVDKLSRPLTRIEPEGTTTWDWGTSAASHNIGQLASVSSPGSYSETYTYDSFARPSQTAIVADGTTYYLNPSYNSSTGFLETLTYPASTGPNRFKLKYGYQNGHLKTIHDYTGDVQTTKFWEAISTNARGMVIDEKFGNELKTFSKYDHIAGWLDYRQSGPAGGSSTQYLNYAWDKVGNLTQRKDENQLLTENFAYDALNRLDLTSGVSSLDLTYNAIGNLTYKSDVGSYTYHATKKHAVTAAGSNSYGYDANGNMNSRNGATLSWFSYNLPSLINQSGGNYSQFWYGAGRQRYKQVNVNGATTETTISVGGMLEKVTVGAATDYKHYVPGGTGVAAIHLRKSTGTNSTYYPLKDHLGSTDRITNSSGAVVVALSYDAFGKRRGSNWTGSPSSGDWTNIAATTRHGFTEHEHLDNLTLIHMNGRVQDPVLGRFLSADPMIQAPYASQAFNRYSYVWNNPLRFTDPSGFYMGTVTSTARRLIDAAGGGGSIGASDNWNSFREVPGTEQEVGDWIRAEGAPAENDTNGNGAPDDSEIDVDSNVGHFVWSPADVAAWLERTFGPREASADEAGDSPQGEDIPECTESLDTEGNWSLTVGGYRGPGAELTFGEDQGNLFVTLRIGLGIGGGASYDPNATIPGPAPIDRNQSGFVLSTSGQLNFNAGPIGANVEAGVARNYNNEESAFFGGPSFSLVSERVGLAASASAAGQLSYYTRRTSYYDDKGTCRAGGSP